MSQVRVLPAAARIDRAVFSRLPEHTEHVTDIGTYVCPHCERAIQFRTSDFEKHFELDFTNLPAEWHHRFIACRPARKEDWESFLDFICPGCKAPVRLIYRAGPEWAMGCHGYELIEVIEAETWPCVQPDA